MKIVASERAGIITKRLSFKGFIKNKTKANAPISNIAIAPTFDEFIKRADTVIIVMPDTSIGRFIFIILCDFYCNTK